MRVGCQEDGGLTTRGLKNDLNIMVTQLTQKDCLTAAGARAFGWSPGPFGGVENGRTGGEGKITLKK